MRRMRMCTTAAMLVAALVAAGCAMQPPPPSPEPAPTAPPAVPADVLDARVALCGSAPAAAERDAAYAAEARIADADGTVLAVEVEVEAGAEEHGRHAVAPPDAVAVRGGAVVGVVVGERWVESGDRAGTLALDVRACPVAGATPDAPLPDGEVELWIGGALDPLDHDHVQAETWRAGPVLVEVTGGAFSALP